MSAKFGKRDLAFALPDECDGRTFQYEKVKEAEFKKRIDKSKNISRHFAGKAPAWLAGKGRKSRTRWGPGMGDPTVATSARRKSSENNSIPADATDSSIRRRFTAEVCSDDDEEKVLNKVEASSSLSIFEKSISSPKANKSPIPSRKFIAKVCSDSSDDSDSKSDSFDSDSSGENSESEEQVAARRALLKAKVLERKNRERLRDNSNIDENNKNEEEMPRGLDELDEIKESIDIEKRIHLEKDVDSEKKLNAEENVDSEYESYSEYETDTESDENSASIQVKPVFVKRSERVTIAQRDEAASKMAEKAMQEMARIQERQKSSRQIVVDEINRENTQEIEDKDSSMVDMPKECDYGTFEDGDKETRESIAYEAWRKRELKRVKKMTALKDAFIAQQKETERRRNLTDEERKLEDEALIKAGVRKDPNAVRLKGGFQQKHYHKGAFYMDQDSLAKGDEEAKQRAIRSGTTDESKFRDIRRLDFHQPTGNDKFISKSLPKIMQVKNFGLKSRTKYTTLREEDTTDRSGYGQSMDYRQDRGAKKLQHSQHEEQRVFRKAGTGDIDKAGRKHRRSKRR